MKRLNRLFLLAGVLATLGISRGNLLAQPGGMDPQEFQQMMRERMMNSFRERLVVTNEAEWKVIESRLSKVMQLRMESLFNGMGAMTAVRAGNREEGQGAGRMRIPGMAEPGPEAEALQNALESDVPAADLRARLERFREARKQKEALLARAQNELRQVLSLRQEALLVMVGFLN